jgi:hypothetical protein
LLEVAGFHNRVIIEPRIFDGGKFNEYKFFGSYEGVSNEVGSLDELSSIFSNPELFLANSRSCHKALEHYMGPADGCTRLRVARQIIDTVTQRKERGANQ